MRLSPEFTYPKYGGHKPTDKYTLQHHLVQIIRFTLIWTLAVVPDQFKHNIVKIIPNVGSYVVTPGRDGNISPRVGVTSHGAAKLEPVPDKVLAVPGNLSQDEYLSPPMFLVMADVMGSIDASTSKVGERWCAILELQEEVLSCGWMKEYDCDTVE